MLSLQLIYKSNAKNKNLKKSRPLRIKCGLNENDLAWGQYCEGGNLEIIKRNSDAIVRYQKRKQDFKNV